MRTLYLDCGMGASGDMLMAALSQVAPEGEKICGQIEGLGLTGVRASAETVLKNGIAGLHIKVTVHGEDEAEPHEHHHEHHPGRGRLEVSYPAADRRHDDQDEKREDPDDESGGEGGDRRHQFLTEYVIEGPYQ